MQTVHNQVFTQILATLLSNNFEALAAVGSMVDNGEGAPPGVFEPWMRTELSCWAETVEGKRIAYIMFRAGPFNEPFQELIASVAEDDLTNMMLKFTIPNDEYKFCEIVGMMTHLVIAQLASLVGKPGCCCDNNPDGTEHIHADFVVAPVEITLEEAIADPTPAQLNDLVLGHYNKKDEGIGRGLTNPFGQQVFLTHPADPVTPSTNVHEFKPRTPKE